VTDRERAERVFGTPGVVVLVSHNERALDVIEAEFAAARLDERARIVAYLRRPRRASLGAYEVGAGAERGRVADEIERGEHALEVV
jgi:hypothetical protein